MFFFRCIKRNIASVFMNDTCLRSIMFFNNVRRWWKNAARRSFYEWKNLLVMSAGLRSSHESIQIRRRIPPTNVTLRILPCSKAAVPRAAPSHLLPLCACLRLKAKKVAFSHNFRSTNGKKDIKCANTSWNVLHSLILSRSQKNKELMTDIITNCKFKNGKRKHLFN